MKYKSFTLATATGNFQQDLYPEFNDNTPNNTYDEWIKGVDTPALKRQITEENFKTRQSVVINMEELT